MTLLEAAMLKAIEAREWIGQGWTRKDGRSPNLVAFIDRFNAVRRLSLLSLLSLPHSRLVQVSNWVGTVVVSGETVEARATLIRYFVLVAQVRATSGFLALPLLIVCLP